MKELSNTNTCIEQDDSVTCRCDTIVGLKTKEIKEEYLKFQLAFKGH